MTSKRNHISLNDRRRSGQAMLIAVMSLGGAILGATAIAGLLTLYQLRASTDSENSAKSLFAADSGVEWALYNYYCSYEGRCSAPPDGGSATPPAINFPASGATLSVTCYDAGDNPSACSDTADTISAITLGSSGDTRRAFSLEIVGSGSSTDP